MLIPMPSPNGTNHERLFINSRRSRGGMAYDAALGLRSDARDTASEGPPIDELTMNQLMTFLDGKLAKEDLDRVQEILLSNDAQPPAAAMDGRARRPAMDEKGRRSFAALYPGLPELRNF